MAAHNGSTPEGTAGGSPGSPLDSMLGQLLQQLQAEQTVRREPRLPGEAERPPRQSSLGPAAQQLQDQLIQQLRIQRESLQSAPPAGRQAARPAPTSGEEQELHAQLLWRLETGQIHRHEMEQFQSRNQDATVEQELMWILFAIDLLETHRYRLVEHLRSLGAGA